MNVDVAGVVGRVDRILLDEGKYFKNNTSSIHVALPTAPAQRDIISEPHFWTHLLNPRRLPNRERSFSDADSPCNVISPPIFVSLMGEC